MKSEKVKKPKRSKAKIVLISLLALAVFFCAVFVSGLLFVKSAAMPKDSADNAKTVRLKINNGMTARQISNELYKNNIIKNAEIFYLFARFPKIASVLTSAGEETFSIKAGVCDISSAMGAAEIYALLSAGIGEQTAIAIPEGLTLKKIAARLEAAGICGTNDFLRAAADEGILREFGISGDTAEGYLFPDTYFFAPDTRAEVCVRLMLNTFAEKSAAIPAFASASDEKRRDIVILASIVEREYRLVEEAPLIAGVFTNRIKNDIGLYSCATVEYIITEILGRPHPDIITYDDLKIQNPYNTYINDGLPPGPISNPGLVALNAAAAPEASDYFYFRVADQDAGRHVFTKTLQEHIDEGVVFNTKRAAN